jgi:hypothetical protein
MSDGGPETLLLKQYEFLRNEIIQCINLRQIAIVGLFTTFFAAVGAVFGWKEAMLLLGRSGALGIMACVVALVVNCFGSLYVHEQIRNRRACSLNRAIEYLLTCLAWSTRGTSQGFLLWENYITSRRTDEYSRPFYFARTMALGLPILLLSVPLIVLAQVLFPPRGFFAPAWCGVLLVGVSLAVSVWVVLGGVAGARRPSSPRLSPARESGGEPRQSGSGFWLRLQRRVQAGSHWLAVRRNRLLLGLWIVYVIPPLVLLISAPMTWSNWELEPLPTAELQVTSQLVSGADPLRTLKGLTIVANVLALALGAWVMRSFVEIASWLNATLPEPTEVLDWLAEQGSWIKAVLGTSGVHISPPPLREPPRRSATLEQALARAVEAWSGEVPNAPRSSSASPAPCGGFET